MKRVVTPTVAAFALIAGTAVSVAQERDDAGYGEAAESEATQVELGQTGPKEGQHQLIGMNVVGPDDEVIAEITNVLIDDEGQVLGVIVRHGTVLGLAGEDAVIPFDRIDLPEARPDMPVEERRAAIEMTSDDLIEMPAYEGYQ
ncbi:MAG: PRC-barrel domain containing protein [Rhodospirillales bacterium]|nr:MAG: PRC-barrel domain containing protein [Rhodospirillales bacterium]